jgi:hypothetical protein
MHNERRRGQWPGATIKYLRCTTSGAAGSGLGTTASYLRAAGLGATIKHLRGAAGIDLGGTQRAPPRKTAWAPRPSTSRT